MLKLLLLLSLTLAGCATPLPNWADLTAPDDARLARWVQQAHASIQLRLSDPAEYPLTLQAMSQLCQSGGDAELLIPPPGPEARAALQGHCLRVWVSDYPEMTRTAPVAVQDTDSLIVYGNLQAVGGPALRHEFEIRQFLLSHSRPLF